MLKGKAWTVSDRYGNDIYLTWERWAYIIELDNHPELEPYFDYIAETIKRGQRRHELYDPNGYQYYRLFVDLPDDNTHMVVCVKFRWSTQLNGIIQEEKFVTTAYFQNF